MKRLKNQTLSNQGFTLIELLVAMTVFIVVLVIASEAFNRIITQSAKLSRMEETNIEGVIGLEMMRHDLEQMGFGLPWGWVERDETVSEGPRLASSTITYRESNNEFGQYLNDAVLDNPNTMPTPNPNPNGVPRAFAGLSPLGNFNSAYFSVKGTTAGRTKPSQRWNYIPFLNFSASTRVSRPVPFASNNLEEGDEVVVINSSPNYPEFDRHLVVNPANSAIFSIPFDTTDIGIDYLPTSSSSTYMLYGLHTSTDTRMPFNRVDFFIDNNSVPTFCAQGAGVLYRANVIHGSSTGGGYGTANTNKIPLLDCVADMQVVLGWDTSLTTPQAGSVDSYSSLPATFNGAVSATNSAASIIQQWLIDPKMLREHLKIIKVYILAQEGRRDSSYNAPKNPLIDVGDQRNIEVGDQIADGGLSPKKIYTLSAEQKKYRWKLYRIVVRPRNLFSNSY